MVTSIVSNVSKVFSLEDWILSPPAHTEWVDGQLIQKDGMTLRHGQIQAKLSTYWRNYMNSSGQGGEVYTDVPCHTNNKVIVLMLLILRLNYSLSSGTLMYYPKVSR